MKVYSQLEKAQLENTTSDTGSLPKGMITYRTDLNIAKVSDGTNMLALVDASSAQTLTNKTYASPITTGAAQFSQITTPANPSSGNNKMYFKADGKLYTLDASGNEAAVGSGSGGVKNLITNGNADDTASSIFVPYADAAGTRPVDGTGGSPTVTTSVSSSSPLDGVKSFLLTKPASNVQGQGWAVPFTVDPAYRAKSLKISADFIVNSGTFVAGANGSTPVDGDLIWTIYDVTNSLIIEPSNIKMFSNSSTVADKFEATFQSSATGSSYRLIAHVASTSALAFELKVDNVTVGPQSNVFGTPVTDWQTYTPVVSGLGSGGLSVLQGYYRQVGDSYEVTIRAQKDGTSGTGSVDISFSLPNAATINTAKAGSAGFPNLGTAEFIDSNFTALDMVTVEGDPTVVKISKAAGGLFWRGNNFAATNILNLNFKVPIVGLSSSAKISDNYDGRLIASSAHVINTVSIPNATFQKVNFESTNYDYTGSLDLTNDRFTAPSAGLYRVSGYVNMAVGTGIRAVTLYKNGVGLATMNATVAVSGSGFSGALPFAHELELVAGDYLEIFAYQDSGGSSNIVGNFDVNFSKIQSPQALLANELVAARYTSSSGQSFASSTAAIVDFNTKDHDTHNAVTTGGSWKFTAPIAGLYEITAKVLFDSQAFSVDDKLAMDLYKNGGNVANLIYHEVVAATTSYYNLFGQSVVYLNAGDYIDVQVFQNSGGARTLFANAVFNYIQVKKLGA